MLLQAPEAAGAAADRQSRAATLQRDQARSSSRRWRPPALCRTAGALCTPSSPTQRAARDCGEGLGIAQLQAEAAATDQALLVSELARLAAREDELAAAQTLSRATAHAESRRQ